jgi:hypothetical protein
MKVIGNKIFVRITKNDRDSIFSKEITRNDGTKTKLFLTVDAKDDEDRKSELFVQTGIIEFVGDSIEGISVGDIAILDYQVSNLRHQLIKEDEEGQLFWINPNTTYYDHTKVVYADRSRQGSRDSIVYNKGDYDEISMLLGIIRNEELIPISPYVFLTHESPIVMVVTKSGLLVEETHRLLYRNVISAPDNSMVRKDETILIDDADVFYVKIGNKKIDCIFESDILAIKK